MEHPGPRGLEVAGAGQVRPDRLPQPGRRARSSTRSCRRAGRELLGIGDLFEYAPGGVDSPVAPLVAIVGIGANADYVNKNPNTVLRFLSVVWRTIDAVQKDPSLYDLQAPYLNSVAGTSLDGNGVEATVDTLHPFAPFEYGKTYFDDQNNVLYYGNAWGAMIKEFVKNEHHSATTG